jgi:hypothetical protein
LELQRHAIGVAHHFHGLSFGDVHVLHRIEQGLALLGLEPLGRLAVAEARGLEDAVGGVGAQAVEGVDQELPDRAGVGLVEQVHEQIFGDVLRRRGAAVGEADLDLKRIPAIHGPAENT